MQSAFAKQPLNSEHYDVQINVVDVNSFKSSSVCMLSFVEYFTNITARFSLTRSKRSTKDDGHCNWTMVTVVPNCLRSALLYRRGKNYTFCPVERLFDTVICP